MILFVLLIAYSRSSANQIILSIMAVVYWLLGYVVIYKKYACMFSVIIFILTALGLAFIYYKVLDPPFWFGFAYIVAWVLLLALADDFFIGGGRWSRKKLLLLTFGVMIISNAVTHSVFTVISPRWSFSVTTDKNTYRLSESVHITVTLENLGFIAHSFKSSISDPIAVSIEYGILSQVWYSPYNLNRTEFTIAPHQTLERTFVWNQTNIHYPEKEIEPKTYTVRACIPSSSHPFIGSSIVMASTSINITST